MGHICGLEVQKTKQSFSSYKMIEGAYKEKLGTLVLQLGN